MTTATAIETTRSPLAGGAMPSSGSVFAAATETVARWVRRSRSRRALPHLDERLLRDVGISRAEAEQEAAKWFWQA